MKMHELPDDYLADALPMAKKIVTAVGAENYNILQVPFSSHPPADPTTDLSIRTTDASHTRHVARSLVRCPAVH